MRFVRKKTVVSEVQAWISPNHDLPPHRIWQCVLLMGCDAITNTPGGRRWDEFPIAFGFMDDFGSLVFVAGGF